MTKQTKSKKYNFASAIFILLFVFVVFQNVGFAQDIKSVENKQNENQDDIIRVDTNLVTIPTTVFDRDGRYVTNLKKEDFQIFEDGIEQEIALFETSEQPFTVLLLLDRSGSMSNRMAELVQAANAFVSQLRPNDQILAATFADDVDVLLQATKVKDLNRIKVRQRRGDSWTMIYDAVEDGLRKMKKVSGRKAIILFSDGIGNGYSASAESNIRDAEENKALIYTIQFNTTSEFLPSVTNSKQYHKKLDIANNYMRDLAQVTGGRKYQIENLNDLKGTFRSIAAELGQQYNLGYYPKQTGKKGDRRQIKVKINQPNLAVKARSSYIIEPQKDKQK